MMTVMPPCGSIVQCRGRQWVVLPSEHREVIRLRPLSGDETQVCGIYYPLELESLEPTQFPKPEPHHIQDQEAALLLLDAARLSLRSGAGPFRCLGKLSVRPRPYQLVPLLMALRLATVRLLIADDVGIGKTIEAGLIARELLERGEAKRLAVLCPPHLCDQWQRELRQKFHIDAVVVRSGTISQLERQLPNNQQHVFGYFRHLVVSLDYAKSERRRASFLAHCPDLVIVDEAHTCTQGNSTGQQQRHQLIEQVAAKPQVHLILLTATPHSGIEASFLSLLGLLKPEFGSWSLEHLTEAQRTELAKHFIQRRRADVRQWLGNETPFPERESWEEPYCLSKPYQDLFEAVYSFARGLVKTVTSEMSYAQRRGRYWSALALIRCVMSSPAAAVATLSNQVRKTGELELDEDLLATYTYDLTEQEQTTDAPPTLAIEQGQTTYKDTERRHLREFIRLAAQLQGKADHKLQKLIQVVKRLVDEGSHPIVWCRYIATANYVAEHLGKVLEKTVRVVAITGALSDDEREIRLAELTGYPQRVLVATDCLSEGINLQEFFDAVIHYDLPWNPNRLEQREGRVDRYGQKAPVVKSYLLYGQDNPVDGAVLDVLIRKAVQIHKTLGVMVPVPLDSTTVAEAVFQSLFDRKTEATQLSLLNLLDEAESPIEKVHQRWEQAVAREKVSRTRFAQRAIKPEEVARELEESDRVLGNEQDVERFVLNALRRLNASPQRHRHGWILPSLPIPLQSQLGMQPRPITFTAPAPAGTELIGRNHPLVEKLAHYLWEDALTNREQPLAARCGVTLTDAVDRPTLLLLLRVRYLLHRSKIETQMAEECFVTGLMGTPAHPQWLEETQVQNYLNNAKPVAEWSLARKQHTLQVWLDAVDVLTPALEQMAHDRAERLAQAHRRVRTITKEGDVRVTPQLPLDILGVYLLQPAQRGTGG